MTDKTAPVTKGDLDELAMQIVRLLEPRFASVEKRMDSFDEKLDRLTSTLDTYLKRVGDVEDENKARDMQFARLERWIETIAQKTGVKLEY